MKRSFATSTQAARALELVSSLQQRFVEGLEKLSQQHHDAHTFTPVEWLRDEGLHGGGVRFEAGESSLYGRGSVNVSQVHYDDRPEKKLGSATAISTIIHPKHPLAPSVHIHISWTEMKSGAGYWRMMADLNPSNNNETHKNEFMDAMGASAPAQFEEAKAQGDRYFFIPVLERHRGIGHFYLENYNTGDVDSDYLLAKSVGEAAINSYLDILGQAFNNPAEATEAQRALQLAYHTLYFFQVLTLDRGTTTGLLVHDQNDVGIMGSLPAFVDKDLLTSWVSRMEKPQDQLLLNLIAALPDGSPCLVDEAVKQKLAAVVRNHYSVHTGAIAMQASGDTIPPTVQNHS